MSPPARKPPTLRDLAEMFDLSTTAISHALREREGTTVRISPETRQRVREAARKLGYRQNIAARALRTGRTGTLGILSFKGLGAFLAKQLLCATDEAEKHGIIPLVYQANPFSEASCLQACHALIDAKVDGVLLLSPGPAFTRPFVRILQEAGIQVTGINTPWIKGISCYLQDKEKGFGQLARHLVDQGYRSITLMIHALPEKTRREQRWHAVSAYEGFRAVAKEVQAGKRDIRFHFHRLPQKTEVLQLPSLRDIDPLSRHGYIGMWQLIQQRKVPRAVMCQVDSWALGALRACAEAGISVPGDVAITGFEDDPAASAGTVPLTTVSSPTEEICRLAFEELLAMTRGKLPQQNRFVAIDGELVVRHSSVLHP